MTSHVLHFAGLTDGERQDTAAMPRVADTDIIELRVRHMAGDEHTLMLPPGAAAAVAAVMDGLSRGERVAVLAEGQDLSPNEAAAVLGMSRPLVVHRMEVGDLPFHYVGKHRRAKLRDVLAFKEKVDGQRAALAALARDTEDLIHNHGL